MFSKILAIIVCLGFLGQVSSLGCKCTDYGTQNSCTAFGTLCYWENNECVQLIQNCDELPDALCLAPSCYLKAANTCVSITTCAALDPTLVSCKTYGCVTSGTTPAVCEDFDTCAAIKSQPVCQNFISYNTNSDSFCSWDKTLSACKQITGCDGLSSALCTGLYFCQFNTKTNTCSNIACDGLNQVSCAFTKSLCVWQTPTTGSSSCVNNNCANYANESSCSTLLNRNFCAWDGKKCDQCDSGSAFISLTASMFLLMIAFVL